MALPFRGSCPLFNSLPPGYSGPAPLPRPAEERAKSAKSSELEDIPFETPDESHSPSASAGLPKPQPAGLPIQEPDPVIEDDRPKIRTFDQALGKRHEDSWARSPNVTGTGAIHVKSFHAKLTGDSLTFLDDQINEWLDAHPQYEVKFVTTSIGTWTGKMKEPNLIVNVWV